MGTWGIQYTHYFVVSRDFFLNHFRVGRGNVHWGTAVLEGALFVLLLHILWKVGVIRVNVRFRLLVHVRARLGCVVGDASALAA